MSNSSFREPTNDELWAQPPAVAHPDPAAASLVPAPPPPLLAPVHPAGAPEPWRRADRTPFVLAIVSVALGIPLTAIGSHEAGFAGLLVTWIGIVAVNFIYDRMRRR